MPRLWKRREALLAIGAGTLATLSGCGTMIYPERRGQAAGPFDWRVILLDSLLLLFFFIPGVIAFAVDFSTGAIYLPEWDQARSRPIPAGPVTKLQLPPGPVTRERIEEALSNHLRRPIRLNVDTLRTRELASVKEMEAVTLAMLEPDTDVTYRCQSPR